MGARPSFLPDYNLHQIPKLLGKLQQYCDRSRIAFDSESRDRKNHI